MGWKVAVYTNPPSIKVRYRCLVQGARKGGHTSLYGDRKRDHTTQYNVVRLIYRFHEKK
jgi:hypothetical protein